MNENDFEILIRNFKLNIGEANDRLMPELLLDKGASAISIQKSNNQKFTYQ